MAPFIHVVPKRLQEIVQLAAPSVGEQCADCRRELPPHRPKATFKDASYCLVCARGMGIVSVQRRPKAAV